MKNILLTASLLLVYGLSSAQQNVSNDWLNSVNNHFFVDKEDSYHHKASFINSINQQNRQRALNLENEQEGLVAMDIPGINRSEFQYNGLGQNSITKNFDWDDNSNVLYLSSEEHYTYSTEGIFESQIIYSEFDTLSSTWTFAELSEFTYLPNGLLEMHIISNQSSGSQDFVLSKKTEYAYNEYDLVITEKNYYYTPESTWDLSEIVQYTYTYTMPGTVESKVVAFQSPPDTFWYKSDSTFFAYNTNGELIEEESYSWDSFELLWYPQIKSILSWDEYGNVIEQNSSMWENEVWAPFILADFVYDLSILNTDVLYPVGLMNDAPFNNKILAQTISIWTGMFFMPFISIGFEYDMISLISSSEFNESVWNVYPNPISSGERLMLEAWEPEHGTGQFSLYNVNGSLLMQQSINANPFVELGNLPAGLYLYQLKSGNNLLHRGKLIVQ